MNAGDSFKRVNTNLASIYGPTSLVSSQHSFKPGMSGRSLPAPKSPLKGMDKKFSEASGDTRARTNAAKIAESNPFNANKKTSVEVISMSQIVAEPNIASPAPTDAASFKVAKTKTKKSEGLKSGQELMQFLKQETNKTAEIAMVNSDVHQIDVRN